ncbi:methylated-DNA--[protein]-cysteine S-methyltransferase [Asticcacaulis solisilvae]|uniref:methylated-DNA--[protein]-cysteine S-methyltransferase n=1 Tax=Asticcacaulis solisilvae TaxID=1217274 RepID=UPI003FD6CE8D
MDAVFYDIVSTPLGDVTAAVDPDGALVEFHFMGGYKSPPKLARPEVAEHAPGRLDIVRRQSDEFFARKRETFDLALRPRGTPFQQKVWRALCDIPFGRTISYQQLAVSIGDIKAVRAVGTANGANPIWLIIPCHRVIGKDGSLTGYGGGLPLKRALLDFETPRLL